MARQLSKRSSKQTKLALAVDTTALYVRVSTDKQADEGYSLDAQQEKLQAYCMAQEWTVQPGHVYVDAGITGKTTDRPQFQAMLNAAKAGEVKRIVAMKLDRIARNVREFLQTVDQLKVWGCDLVLVKESFDTSTPHGRFALTMFAAMAELEAATITERVMSGKEQKAKEGGYNGSRCPLGYDYIAGHFEVNDQAATVRSIFDMFVGGAKLSAIASTLNERQVATVSGGRWYASTVRYILSNGIYAGIGQWNGHEAEDVYPSIVNKEVYEQASRRLQALRPGLQLESEIGRRLAVAQ